MTFTELYNQLTLIANAEDGPFFVGRPERWWDDPTWRCLNDHVSKRYLKSEELGANVCLACREPITLTFPEDQDGPLTTPSWTHSSH